MCEQRQCAHEDEKNMYKKYIDAIHYYHTKISPVLRNELTSGKRWKKRERVNIHTNEYVAHLVDKLKEITLQCIEHIFIMVRLQQTNIWW